MSFDDLGLSPALLRALEALGYDTPTPIQEQALPSVLEGRDLLGCAQTGTGKTAAFALPILQRLAARRPAHGPRPVRALVLAPTRELCAQVAQSFRDYGRHLPLRTAEVYGGVSERPQIAALEHGVDVLVATPGRLQDLMGRRFVRLDRVEVLVLDEADRMLDMGFIHDIRRIVAAVPSMRQTLLFSATLPREILDLARGLLSDPVEVSVTPPSSVVDTIQQQVFFVPRAQKQALLAHLLEDGAISRALVFTRTKHGADRVCRHLTKADVPAAAIHGNKSQNARTRALEGFRDGSTRVLVASDIAARGLDIDDVSHVINFDLPNEPETYVHRIGRTGRAGAAGTALSFCDVEERAHLRGIERLIGRRVTVAAHPFGGGGEPPAERAPQPPQPRGRAHEPRRPGPHEPRRPRPHEPRHGRPQGERRHGHGQGGHRHAGAHRSSTSVPQFDGGRPGGRDDRRQERDRWHPRGRPGRGAGAR